MFDSVAASKQAVDYYVVFSGRAQMKQFIVDNYGSKQQSGEEDSLVRGFLVPTIAHNNVSLCIAKL